MGRAADRIALIEVVGANAALEQTLHQGLHDRDVVVDALHEHGLAAQWNAGIGEAGGRFGNLGCQLAGMGAVDAHPQRMILLENRDQVLGDALRQDHRDLGADTQELDMLDGAQPPQQPVQLVVADGERVAARKQDVADLGVLLQIAQRLFPLLEREIVLAARIADDAGARAIAAIGRTGPGGQEQDAVGIAVHDAGHDGVVVFAQRVVVLAGGADVFAARGDMGPAQRLHRILQIHQAGVIGRDADRQRALVAGDRVMLVGREAEDAVQLFQGADAGTHLPAPVVPLYGRGAGIELFIEGAGVGVHGETECGLLRGCL